MFESKTDGTPQAIDIDELCSLPSGTKVRVYEDLQGHRVSEGEIIDRAYPEADQVDASHASVWYLVWLSHCDICSAPHGALALWSELEPLR